MFMILLWYYFIHLSYSKIAFLEIQDFDAKYKRQLNVQLLNQIIRVFLCRIKNILKNNKLQKSIKTNFLYLFEEDNLI